MSDYSEAELSLIESRKQAAGGGQASSSSVDQISTPRIDRKPQAKDVDLPGMVDKVNEAAKQQQAGSPTVFDTLDKDMPWLKWVGGALGVAYGLGKVFGGDDNNPPNTPPNNRTPSPKDRSLIRKEPTFDAETTQSSMTAGEPKIVADPVPVAPKPVTDVVTVPPVPETTANVVPTSTQPQNVAVAPPPTEASAAPVAPKPLSEIEQLKLDKAKFELEAAKAKEARAAELHANRLAADAKRAETKVQQGQGKAFNNQDNTILANAEKIKAEKALEAAGLKKPTKQAPAASVAPPVAAPEATPPKAAAAPSTPPADKFVLPISSNPAETALTKEQTSARGWLANQYGGNNKYYEAVQDIFGGVPPSYNAAAGEKAIGKDAHQVVMDWRKANIEGPKVNLTHDMKKVLKGGGGLAVLMSLPGFAEAAQNKDMGKMSDIFTDFFVLPFAQSREAGMPKAQEESTIAAKFKEASKLGSPYRSVPPPR